MKLKATLSILVLLNLTLSVSASNLDRALDIVIEKASELASQCANAVEVGFDRASESAKHAAHAMRVAFDTANTELANPGETQALVDTYLKQTAELAAAKNALSIIAEQLRSTQQALVSATQVADEATAKLNAPSKLNTIIANTNATIENVKNHVCKFTKDNQKSIIIGATVVVIAGITYVLYKRKQTTAQKQDEQVN